MRSFPLPKAVCRVLVAGVVLDVATGEHEVFGSSFSTAVKVFGSSRIVERSWLVLGLQVSGSLSNSFFIQAVGSAWGRPSSLLLGELHESEVGQIIDMSNGRKCAFLMPNKQTIPKLCILKRNTGSVLKTLGAISYYTGRCRHISRQHPSRLAGHSEKLQSNMASGWTPSAIQELIVAVAPENVSHYTNLCFTTPNREQLWTNSSPGERGNKKKQKKLATALSRFYVPGEGCSSDSLVGVPLLARPLSSSFTSGS